MANEAITTAATLGALDFLDLRSRDETSERSEEDTEAGLMLSLLSWVPFLLPWSSMSTWWPFRSLVWWPILVLVRPHTMNPLPGQYSCSSTHWPAVVEGETLRANEASASKPSAPGRRQRYWRHQELFLLARIRGASFASNRDDVATQFAEESGCNRKDELGACVYEQRKRLQSFKANRP